MTLSEYERRERARYGLMGAVAGDPKTTEPKAADAGPPPTHPAKDRAT